MGDFPGRVFCWSPRRPSCRVADRYRPETRLVHAGTLRSQFGETSEALFLTQGYVYESSAQAERALQGRGAGLPVFALRQPDGRDVRGAHGGVRGRRGRARDRDRHGGGDGRAARPAQGGRSCGRREGAVRLVPLCGGGFPAALRRRLDAGRRHRPRRSGRTRCGRTPRPSSSRARPIRTSRSSTSPRWRRSRMRRGATLVVDNVFATPLFQIAARSSAPTASSIRRPSTSTARAAASAAWCSASEKFIQDNVHNLIRQTGPVDLAVQCLGAAQGAGDAERARATGRPTRPRPSRSRWSTIRRSRA